MENKASFCQPHLESLLTDVTTQRLCPVRLISGVPTGDVCYANPMFKSAIKTVIISIFFAGISAQATEESSTISLLQIRSWMLANPPEGYSEMVKRLMSDDPIERYLGLAQLEDLLPNNHWSMFVEQLLAMAKSGAKAETRQELFLFRRARWPTISTLQEVEAALKTDEDREVRLRAIQTALGLWSDNIWRYPISSEVQQAESYIAIIELAMRDQYDRVREDGYNLLKLLDSTLSLETLERFLVFPESRGRIEQKIARQRRETMGDCSGVLRPQEPHERR